MLDGKQIGFIGGGNMAEALIRGLVQGGVAAGSLRVAEPLQRRREYLADRYQVEVSENNAAVVERCDVLLMAVKPQVASAALGGISAQLTAEKLLISMMAGVPSAALEAAFLQPVRVVRVMPNTPALVLQGATGIAPGAHALEQDLAVTQAIFGMVGKCWVVDERLIDAVTGLSGSGPAYVLTFIEALSDAGVKNGLPRETAFGLALQTVLGTASLLAETGDHPAVLREKVTSPGGTTIAGLKALEIGSFRGTVMQAVDAATARSVELGKKA
ncbi:MAG: pyrroline-5-carboxylate reductase [Geobacter sp.]|nr:pyrroline-5-carboxylate reductase [Geobacter sp.]